MAETATGKLEGIPFSISLGELELLVNRGSAEQLGNALTFLPGHRMVDLINHQIRNHNGRTLVHLAAQSGNYECLDLLLQAGGMGVTTITIKDARVAGLPPPPPLFLKQ